MGTVASREAAAEPGAGRGWVPRSDRRVGEPGGGAQRRVRRARAAGRRPDHRADRHAVILRITWQSFNTVRNDPGEPEDLDEDHDEQGDHADHDDDHGMRSSTAHDSLRPAACAPAPSESSPRAARSAGDPANTARNARGRVSVGMLAGHRPARRCGAFLDPFTARTVRAWRSSGAGNGDHDPARADRRRAGEVALIDLDGPAIRAARRRQPTSRCAPDRCGRARRHRRRCGRDRDRRRRTARSRAPVLCEAPLPGAPYDLVVGDLLYSQLLYPALVDLERSRRQDCSVPRSLRARPHPLCRCPAACLGT